MDNMGLEIRNKLIDEEERKENSWDRQNLKWLYNNSGVSVKQISEATGIKESSLKMYLSGYGNPNLNAVIALADYFQVPVDYLVGRCSERENKEIFEHYADYFAKLRNASYSAYLFNKYVGDDTLKSKYVFTWPFNLVESIFQKEENECIEFDYEGLEEAISTLTDREKEAVDLRYRKEKTLTEVANDLQISPERVRQVLAKACRKLRHPARLRLIRYGNLGLERMKELNEREAAIAEKEKELEEREKRLSEEEKEAGINDSGETAMVGKQMAQSIMEMELSVRAYNCLVRFGCKTVGDVRKVAESGKLLKIRNMGVHSAQEVLYVLKDKYGVDCMQLYGF